MGNVVARVRYRMTRPLREYNLEERAYTAIKRNKEISSPRHPSTDSLIEKALRNLSPEVKDELENPNPKLDSHLRKVFVTSKDVTPVQPVSQNNPERPLPLNRSPVQPAVYGYHDPKVVPYGKVRLRDVLEFLTKHREDPEQHTAARIASTYKLDEQLTAQVLKYFGVFRMVVPMEQTEKQSELLKRLRAAPDSMPNTPLLQHTLHGVPVLGKPTVGDTEGKLPVTQIRAPEVDRSHEVSLLNYKFKDPLSKGRQKGDPYFKDEESLSEGQEKGDLYLESKDPLGKGREKGNPYLESEQPASDDRKADIIGVPVRSPRRPEDVRQSEAQKAERK